MKTSCLAGALLALLFAHSASAQDGEQSERPYPLLSGAKSETYKTVGDVKLNLFIFHPKDPTDARADRSPADRSPADRSPAARPAIVFFFGGGFVSGSPAQFAKHCEYFASRGMVAITAEYRVKNRHGTTPADSVEDGKDAMRWVRKNARRLSIDPDRIVASGGSAGGFIAACVGVTTPSDQRSEKRSDKDEGQSQQQDENRKLEAQPASYTPGAMVLFNPAIVGKTPLERTNPDGKPSFTKAIMPYFQIHEDQPPCIMFFGTEDRFLEGAKEFQQASREKGNRCEIITWEGAGHGFFNFGRGDNKYFLETVREADKFLVSLGYLEGPPTIEAFVREGRAAPQEAPPRNQQPRNPRNQRRAINRIAEMLKRFDKNEDNALEEKEVPPPIWRRVGRADEDKDGKVTEAELRKMRGLGANRRGGRPGEIITPAARGERYDDTLQTGDLAPDFTLPDPSGKREVRLSSFQGKRPVVLIFGSYT